MKSLRKSIEYERYLGHDVWVISGNADNNDKNHLYIPTLQRNINLFADFMALLRLISIIRTISPDIIHSHESKAGALSRILYCGFKNI